MLNEDEESLFSAQEFEGMRSLREALDEEKGRSENYLANWQRAEADFIKYKKRTEQERIEMAKNANAELILNLLPVLDDLELAFASISAEVAGLTWIDGIVLIQRKLETVLESQGLSKMETLGHDFDPNLHEAVTYREGDDGKVIDELRRGYKLYGRVIRPAAVVVGKGKKKTKDSNKPIMR